MCNGHCLGFSICCDLAIAFAGYKIYVCIVCTLHTASGMESCIMRTKGIFLSCIHNTGNKGANKMKKVLCIIAVLMAALGVVSCAPAQEQPVEPGAEVIVFNDPVLEEKVREAMNKPEGDITFAEAEAVTFLDLSCSDPMVPEEEKIKDIGALAYFKNLGSINLSWNSVTDLTPLAGLYQLEALYMNGNKNISDFSPLAGLTNMKDLNFIGNANINDSNISFIVNMTQMEMLWIAGSPELSDISPVANFSNLYRLILTDCGVIDISPIAGLNNLKELWLKGNPITDYSPLRDIYPNLENKDFELP